MRARHAVLTLVFALACASPRPALADDTEALRRSGHAWFDGERNSGWLWGGAGLSSLGTAAALHRFGDGSSMGRGMAYPMLGFGVLQTAIGLGSLLRGSGRSDDFDASVTRSPRDTRESEIARMRTVRYAFVGLEVVWTALILGSVGYAATRTGPDQELSRGVALGLAMEGAAMLLLDTLASARANRYAGQLDGISFTAVPTAGGTALSFKGVF